MTGSKKFSAADAKELSAGKKYSDYVLEEVFKGIRHVCGQGAHHYQYMTDGSRALHPETKEEVAKELRERGFFVEIGHIAILISWKNSKGYEHESASRG